LDGSTSRRQSLRSEKSFPFGPSFDTKLYRPHKWLTLNFSFIAIQSNSNATRSPEHWLPLLMVFALWAPAMIAASYIWKYGDYYDYGWFVPPAAMWLSIRRWKDEDLPVVLPSRNLLIAGAVLLFPWILLLRILGHTDPSWRLPIGTLGVTAAICSHVLIGMTRGWRASAGYLWITLLWLSALPWFFAVERGIIHHLTQGVIAAAAEVFQLFGTPVEVIGDQMILHDVTVEVTDGCSGVRSFQSFVMASWFFSELHRLSLTRALVLLVFSCAAAFLVNMSRTYALAHIRFEHGKEAFDQAHDWLGLLAFIISGVLFFWISGRLATFSRRVVTRTVQS
jgi:exosortase